MVPTKPGSAELSFRVYSVRSGSETRVIIVEADQGVFPAGQSFIRELKEFRNAQSSTLRDVAYILASWCRFLQGRGRHWHEANAEHFRVWLNTHSAYRTRKARRSSVVWRWYRYLAGTPAHAEVARPIFEALSRPTNKSDFGQPRYSVGVGSKLKSGRRPVPKVDQVSALKDHIIARPEYYVNERDWLIVRFQSECGLRALGISNMSVELISRELSKLKVIPPGTDLLAYAHNVGSQGLIRAKLDALSGTGVNGIIFTIVEKFSKRRDVLLRFDLLLNTLDFIWENVTIYARAKRASPHFTPLFISQKTYRSLLPGSISDRIKSWMKSAGMPGSGHSLRAFRITERALEIIRYQKSLGKLLDTETIGTLLADEFGHERPETLRHYVDHGRVADAMAEEIEDHRTTIQRSAQI